MRIIAAMWLAAAVLFAWDSKIHSGIIHASLTAISREDRIEERWDDEVWRLREYVQMADWIHTLVSQREEWDTGGQTLEQPGLQFFANDYLMFPSSPHAYPHMAPEVKSTYRPFFLRALQALRTESPANAARWTGSLLHYVTDSGSPPHAIGLSGPAHTKMESWLDPAVIDLSHYRPQLLGDTDEAAVAGLQTRMDGLIAFSAIRGKAMLPFVKMDDRAHMEPLAVEAAAETARVAADVIHTLLKLTEPGQRVRGTSLLLTVTAPNLEGMENVPAKLMLSGTDYSTLSEPSTPGFHTYRGTLLLSHIPSGKYSAVIERVGSRTETLPMLEVMGGLTVTTDVNLHPSAVPGNLVANPDFTVHWLSPEVPDHWRLDALRHQWVSDNIPVTAGKSYRAGCVLGKQTEAGVELQWMAHAWEAMKAPTVQFDFSSAPRADISVTVPAGVLFARFVFKGEHAPASGAGSGVYLKADPRP